MTRYQNWRSYRLARILTYDNEQVERENEGSYDEDEFYNSRNLENGLLKS